MTSTCPTAHPQARPAMDDRPAPGRHPAGIPHHGAVVLVAPDVASFPLVRADPPADDFRPDRTAVFDGDGTGPGAV